MRFAVVFGSDHHNALGVIRSLGEKGIKSFFILSSSQEPSHSFTSKSKYVIESYRGSDSFKLNEALLSLKKLSPSLPIVLYTTCDTSAKIFSEFQEINPSFDVISFSASYENLGIVEIMNKEFMMELANDCGLTIPKSLNLKLEAFDKGDVKLSSYHIIYPCITKPNKSIEGSKNDIIICNDEKDLIIALNKIPNRKQSVLIQEYVCKDYEMSILGLSTLNSNMIIIPGIIKKIREYPFNMGSSSFSVYMDSVDNYIDRVAVNKFINLINYKGLFSIEFLYSKGKLYFLEINLRNDGNGVIPTRCGYNLPYYWYCDALRIPFKINESLSFKNHYFMIEAGDIQYLLKRKIRFSRWLKCLFQTNTFMMLSGNDFSPLFYKLKKLLK